MKPTPMSDCQATLAADRLTILGRKPLSDIHLRPTTQSEHPLLWYSRRMRFALLALLLLTACDRRTPAGPPLPDAPPSGRGIHQDGQRTLFRPLGVITYGADEEEAVPDARALIGYEFEGSAGDVPVVSVSAPGRLAIAIYGPRGADGLWDNALQSGAHPANVTLSGEALPASGMYFILVRTLELEPMPFSLRLRCAEGPCEIPECATPACDRFCPGGYAFDDDLCRECACVEPACVPGSCPDGERCVAGNCEARGCEDDCPPGSDPVCGADGRTYRTACNAECRGVEVESRGMCAPAGCSDARPCLDGQDCVDGRCVRPSCECPDTRTPVCDTAGRTHANECQMRCAGAELDYPRPCIEGFCRDPGDCADAERCEPLPDPLNLRQCARAPESPECIRRCAPAEVCGDAVCPIGEQCARPDADTAFCTRPCRNIGDACDDTRVCHGRPGALQGACLPICGADRSCPGTYECNATAAGPVCLPPRDACPCPEAAPEETVCIEGTTYASTCFARCAGAEEAPQRGACPDEPEPDPEPECDCPVMREPLVCGADRRVYSSRCEARCNRIEPLPLEQCVRAPVLCRVDDDCIRTGCDGSICAAEPVEACPDLTDDAACRARGDMCLCLQGQCQFTLTRESAECLGGRP